MEKLLQKAVDKGIISSFQKEELLKLYKKEKFNPSKIAVFLAQFLGIGLVTSMMGMGLDLFGLMVSSFFYLVIFYFVIEKVEDGTAKKSASVFIMLLIPLFIASFMQYFNLLKGGFLFEKEVLIVSVIEILVALFLIKKVNFPFLVVFIVLSVYSGIVSLSILLSLPLSFDLAAVFVGFYTMGIAYFLDKKKYSDWLYISGSIMFWLGMSYSLNSETLYTLYLFVNISLFIAGILLYKRVFIMLSIVGFLFYIWHLAFKFKDNEIITLVFVNSIGFLSVALIIFAIKYKNLEEIFYEKFAFIRRIDKKWLLVLLFFPFIYLSCYKKTEFLKEIENLEKIEKNQTKTGKRNFQVKQNISDGKLIDLNCNGRIYKLRKLKAIFISKNNKVSKTIYVYKGYSFDSLEEFKKKYCR